MVEKNKKNIGKAQGKENGKSAESFFTGPRGAETIVEFSPGERLGRDTRRGRLRPNGWAAANHFFIGDFRKKHT